MSCRCNYKELKMKYNIILKFLKCYVLTMIDPKFGDSYLMGSLNKTSFPTSVVQSLNKVLYCIIILMN